MINGRIPGWSRRGVSPRGGGGFCAGGSGLIDGSWSGWKANARAPPERAATHRWRGPSQLLQPFVRNGRNPGAARITAGGESAVSRRSRAKPNNVRSARAAPSGGVGQLFRPRRLRPRRGRLKQASAHASAGAGARVPHSPPHPAAPPARLLLLLLLLSLTRCTHPNPPNALG